MSCEASEYGRKRYQRILLSTASGWGARFVNTSINLVSVPLTVKYLGVERYGIWITISSVLGWLALSDLGMANYLTTTLAMASGKDDMHVAERNTTAVFWSLIGLTLLLAVVSCAVWPILSWHKIFNTSQLATDSETAQVVMAVLIMTLAMIPLSLAYRVLDAYQEGWKANVYQAGSSLIALTALLFGVRSKAGLPALAIILLFPVVATSAVANVFLFGLRRPGLIRGPKTIERQTLVKAFRGGSWFFLIALQSLFWLTKDNLVIAQVLGPGSVGPYNMGFRVYASLLGLLGSRVGQSMWPAYAEAIGRNHWGWIRSAYRKASLLTVAIYLIIATAFAVFSAPLIRLWTGPSLAPSPAVIWSLTAEFAVLCWINLMGYLLMAANRPKAIAVSGLIAGAFSVPLSMVLAKSMGLAGVPIANLLCLVILVVAPLRSATNNLLSEGATEVVPQIAPAGGIA